MNGNVPCQESQVYTILEFKQMQQRNQGKNVMLYNLRQVENNNRKIDGLWWDTHRENFMVKWERS